MEEKEINMENKLLWDSTTFLAVFDDFRKVMSSDMTDGFNILRVICEVGPTICSKTLKLELDEVKGWELSKLISTFKRILETNTVAINEIAKELKNLNLN